MKSSAQQQGESRGSRAEVAEMDSDPLGSESEVFSELTCWMISQKEKHSTLCLRNIATHLRGSNMRADIDLQRKGERSE